MLYSRWRAHDVDGSDSFSYLKVFLKGGKKALKHHMRISYRIFQHLVSLLFPSSSWWWWWWCYCCRWVSNSRLHASALCWNSSQHFHIFRGFLYILFFFVKKMERNTLVNHVMDWWTRMKNRRKTMKNVAITCYMISRNILKITSLKSLIPNIAKKTRSVT
jgi:hypothetical protein